MCSNLLFLLDAFGLSLSEYTVNDEKGLATELEYSAELH